MAAVAAPRLPQWVPQDDLLLKNALEIIDLMSLFMDAAGIPKLLNEAGASLESLAKGAVQFSRRFTIRELQNRWNSLLYDDVVASEVADQILLLESSVSISSKDNKLFSLRGKECISRKRNVESVRGHYYSLTKRTCNEPANFVYRKSFLDPSSYNGDEVESSCEEKFIRGPTDETCRGQYIGSDKDTDDIPQILEDNLNAFYNGSHSWSEGHPKPLTVSVSFLKSDVLHPKEISSFSSRGIHQLECSSPLPHAVIGETIGAFSEPVALEVKESGFPLDVDGEKLITEYVLQSEPNVQDRKIAVSEIGFLELPCPLLEFSYEEENFCMDIDDGNSVLVKSPVINDEKGSLVAQSSVIAEDRLHKQLDIVGTGLQTASSDDPNFIPLQCNEVPVASHQITYKYEECLFCTLNAEDLDIPDNNDIFPSVDVVCKDEFAKRETCDEGPVLRLEGISALTHNLVGCTSKGCVEVSSVQTTDHVKKSEIIELPSSLHAIQDPDSRISEPGLATDTTFETHDTHTADGFENSKDFHLNQLNSRLSKCYSHCSQEPNDTSKKIMICSSNNKHQIGEKGIMESTFSTSNHEESTNGSDSDVPYFSDIEAMILDMDLGTCDDESCFAREVSTYQFEDSKKTIIRLEQGANSYMQRAIACHGALAVFYGRQVKYYIKKAEVVIGRATDDVNVDIDLKKEGRANKVSRRQAIIKMEEDGLFHLTNLGKHPISVNNRDVASGHCTSLNSSCLIEITGMRFVFEMNRHLNNQYVSNIALRKFSRGQLEKFEFLPDDNY